MMLDSVREALERQVCVLASRKGSRLEIEQMLETVEEADTALEHGDA